MDSAGFIAMANDLLQYSQWLPDNNVIFDHTDLDFSNATVDDLRKIRSFHKKNEAKIGSGKSAIIVKPGLSEQWHKLWSQGKKLKTANQAQVFENYADAFNWISKGD